MLGCRRPTCGRRLLAHEGELLSVADTLGRRSASGCKWRWHANVAPPCWKVTQARAWPRLENDRDARIGRLGSNPLPSAFPAPPAKYTTRGPLQRDSTLGQSRFR